MRGEALSERLARVRNSLPFAASGCCDVVDREDPTPDSSIRKRADERHEIGVDCQLAQMAAQTTPPLPEASAPDPCWVDPPCLHCRTHDRESTLPV